MRIYSLRNSGLKASFLVL